jgi:chromate transporter
VNSEPAEVRSSQFAVVSPQSASPAPRPATNHQPPVTVRLRDLALVCARVGAFGFGGGMAMLSILREHVLNRRKWISETEFTTAVAMAQMVPGPFIPNVAEYIGYRLRGFKGMLLAAISFLLPSVLAILVLSVVYFRYGSVPAVQFAFRGIGPVVSAILLVATWQIARTSVKSWRSVFIGILAFAGLLFKKDVLLIIAMSGALGILLFVNFRARRLYGFVPWLFAPWFMPAALALQPESGAGAVLRRGTDLLAVFLKIGTIVWGGGFAAIPFIRSEVVDARHWLTAREFIDGVALGQITPGPVAITATFVGYRVLGIAGAVLSTIAMFLPSFVILLLLLRVYDRIREHYLVKGFLQGIMPAVVGMLLSAAVVIGRDSITTIPAAGLGLLGLILLAVVKLDPVWLVLGGGVVGILLGARL